MIFYAFATWSAPLRSGGVGHGGSYPADLINGCDLDENFWGSRKNNGDGVLAIAAAFEHAARARLFAERERYEQQRWSSTSDLLHSPPAT